MAESIGVLVVFFFLLMIGFRFYTHFQMVSVQEKLQALETQRAIQVAQIASELPELQCSYGTEKDSIESVACLDILKIQSSSTVLNANKLFYFDLLQYANITVHMVYPSVTSFTFPMNIYENIPLTYSSKIKTYFPVLLKDAKVDRASPRYYFGILEIDYYKK